MSKTIFKYGLWAATLFVVAWATALVSALVGSKGIDKMKAIAVDGAMPGEEPVLFRTFGEPKRGRVVWAGPGADLSGFDSGAGEVLSGD